MGMEGASLVDFPQIKLLDTLLRFSGGVCSLREIWERPLVGPFLYISDTILNTSSIFFNISFLIDCLPLLCHSPSLLLGLFRNRHCFPTADFLCPLLFPRISSLLAFSTATGSISWFSTMYNFSSYFYPFSSFLVTYLSNT